ncbi:MAG: hypothetical protein ACFBRM_14120 [Pikeienuella sp.]
MSMMKNVVAGAFVAAISTGATAAPLDGFEYTVTPLVNGAAPLNGGPNGEFLPVTYTDGTDADPFFDVSLGGDFGFQITGNQLIYSVESFGGQLGGDNDSVGFTYEFTNPNFSFVRVGVPGAANGLTDNSAVTASIVNGVLQVLFDVDASFGDGNGVAGEPSDLLSSSITFNVAASVPLPAPAFLLIAGIVGIAGLRGLRTA